MTGNEIILVGAGGHCKSVIDVIEAEGKYRIVGIVDIPEKIGQTVLGYKIIGSDDDIPEFSKHCRNFIITIGQIKSSKLRREVYHKLKKTDANLPVVISPRAYVSKNAKIGEGTVIMHNALINADGIVGCNCIINTGSLIEHEAIIGDFSHISTYAVINGQAEVGKDSFVGSNAVLSNNISIPEGTIVAAGTSIYKSPDTKGTYIGSFPRKIS